MAKFTVFCAHGCGQPVAIHEYPDHLVPSDINSRLAQWGKEYYITGHEPILVNKKLPIQEFAEKLDPLAPVTGAKLQEMLGLLRPDVEIAKADPVVTKAKI